MCKLNLFVILILGVESVWCCLINNYDNVTSPTYFGTVCQCPTCPLENFLSWTSSVRSTFLNNCKVPKIVIISNLKLLYFNWSLPAIIDSEPSHLHFLSFFYEHGLPQWNNLLSRDANTLYLLITNIPDRITNFSLRMPFSSSDHNSFSFSLGIFLIYLFLIWLLPLCLILIRQIFFAMKVDLQSIN